MLVVEKVEVGTVGNKRFFTFSTQRKHLLPVETHGSLTRIETLNAGTRTSALKLSIRHAHCVEAEKLQYRTRRGSQPVRVVAGAGAVAVGAWRPRRTMMLLTRQWVHV